MTSLRVYEMEVKVFTLQNFGQEEASMIVAGFFDGCLSKNDEFLKFHKENCFKGYGFDLPYELEKDGIYKKEKVYTIHFRTVNKNLLNYLQQELQNTTSEYIKGLTTKVRVVPRKHITKIYSLTPVILKIQEGNYWKNQISFERYEELLITNLIKKYNYLMNTKIDENFQFYTNIRKINRLPIAVKYKNITLLGDKFDIEIAENETAQNLAYLSLAAGLGENNSRGAGYVNYKFL